MKLDALVDPESVPLPLLLEQVPKELVACPPLLSEVRIQNLQVCTRPRMEIFL
jgi:hypothetical protein